MISEFPNIPRQLTPEDRFIISLKNELRRHAQEINKLAKNIKGIDLSNLTVDLSDYYTKEEIDQAVQELQQAIDTIPDDVVTQTELEQALSNIDVDLPSWIDKIKVDTNGKLCQVVST